MSKDEYESFNNQIRMNHLTYFLGGENPLSYYTLTILNTIYKAGPTTNSQATQKWFHTVKMRNHWVMSNLTTCEELDFTFSQKK